MENDLQLKAYSRGAWVAQLVKHFSLGHDLLSPGMEPRLRLPAQWGICFSLSHCPSTLLVLVHALSQINKILK